MSAMTTEVMVANKVHAHALVGLVRLVSELLNHFFGEKQIVARPEPEFGSCGARRGGLFSSGL